jgi:hypothetical protein
MVEVHALDKVQQEVPPHLLIGAAMPSSFRRRTELPDAGVNKILMVGRSQGSRQLGLFPNEPL